LSVMVRLFTLAPNRKNTIKGGLLIFTVMDTVQSFVLLEAKSIEMFGVVYRRLKKNWSGGEKCLQLNI
jgi:hypothetical protein